VLEVPEDLARRFRRGDALVYAEAADELLLVPSAERAIAAQAVEAALGALAEMRAVDAAAIDSFYNGFARRLESDATWSLIAAANALDVEDARARGRSTTRLVATERLRRGMIDGLRTWAGLPVWRGRVLETVEHAGWAVDLVAAELGVVGFVFEGRPNVLADATGVLKGGNTVVFRIGRDALRTATTIMQAALTPALVEAGLPEGAVCLLGSSEHAAGWALFGDRRLSLAVARGSGRAVAVLGSLARQAGVPVSLHGTGGAWLVAARRCTPEDLERVVTASLDRKVCNTLNVCCILASEAARLVPAFLRGLSLAGERRGQAFKLHVAVAKPPAAPSEPRVALSSLPADVGELFERRVTVVRAEGPVQEPQAEWLEDAELGREWEWEETPEVTLKLVGDLDQAIALCNAHSPKLVACLLSPDPAEQTHFFNQVDAPFIGDDYTRWVDGQLALRRPELGLSNWEHGRLLARGGVLSGDSIYTVRTRARQT
jgi:glutamate-5-semialdehyde dehydrogenase